MHLLREAHLRAVRLVKWHRGLCEATDFDPKSDPITLDAEYVAETLRRALRFDNAGAASEPTEGGRNDAV
jgi:hypothetical protein